MSLTMSCDQKISLSSRRRRYANNANYNNNNNNHTNNNNKNNNSSNNRINGDNDWNHRIIIDSDADISSSLNDRFLLQKRNFHWPPPSQSRRHRNLIVSSNSYTSSPYVSSSTIITTTEKQTRKSSTITSLSTTTTTTTIATSSNLSSIIVKKLGGFLLCFIIILLQLDLVITPVKAVISDPTAFEGGANSNIDSINSAVIGAAASVADGRSKLGSGLSGGGSGSVSNSNSNSNSAGTIISSSSNIGGSGHYLDKLDKLERSVAAVLIKVAYGTTSTTKRSIPDNSYVPSLTTVATPPLTTLRYLEKSQHQQQINLHHRNYELDLERDHALPTSAPNADILKSNSNPTYPNPNRHHNHDRDRHRHVLNSTPSPSIHNLKKGQPTIPMYSGDMLSYSPPARSFFTPPLPPEYQNPFADKPTLRGTNNDAGIINVGSYSNKRPIPPPSLMPGHERIPLRPPDLNPGSDSVSSSSSSRGGTSGNTVGIVNSASSSGGSIIGTSNGNNGGNSNGKSHGSSSSSSSIGNEDGQRKKALNTPSQKVSSTNSKSADNFDGFNNIPPGSGINLNETVPNSGAGPHLKSISRIMAGSNGRKEEFPEALLPNFHPPSSPVKQSSSSSLSPSSSSSDGRNSNINQSKNSRDESSDGRISSVRKGTGGIGGSQDDVRSGSSNVQLSEDDDFESTYNSGMPGGGDSSINNHQNNNDQEEPKTQPKIKMSTKSTENPYDDGGVYSTQIIHNLANINNEKSLLTTSTPSGSGSGKGSAGSADGNSNTANGGASGSSSSSSSSGSGGNSKDTNESGGSGKQHGVATWAVAWNIHVYLSAILFTILAVYSIFKMIFYDKLTHLFNQSYFICIHLILILICMARIFYLCYDAYNIHSSFHLFVSEILLNLPATFLTISFAVLILFLLIRSLNHKNNRYSALIRPLTVVVGSSVHVGLCITLHYVESYTTNHSPYYQQQQQQLYRNGYRVGGGIGGSGGSAGIVGGNGGGSGSYNLHHHHTLPPPPPPRVLSLICQIIYIFVCLSLGLLYLYIYRILKRVLRSKSQNYIHGYQNLSYAIHITIATALLFVLLAALQIYGAISISTTRPLITSSSEIDWLQWGYQFSLRLIEIAIITLMSWVAGLKTGGTSGVLQREKTADTHNVSGFALFPCTSSSSQEHFETDYPAVCNANTNLHTYTLRTGKPIYDDNFALNSLGGGNSGGATQTGGGGPIINGAGQRIPPNNDFQLQNSNDFVRSYETSSLRSGSGGGGGGGAGAGPGHSHHHHHHHHHQSQIVDNGSGHHSDFLNDPQIDHYENPNFELRSNKIDNCYSEPLNSSHHGHHMMVNGGRGGVDGGPSSGYDFQNFERPIFSGGGGGSSCNERPNSRSGGGGDHHKINKQLKSNAHHLDRSNYENPERRSANSTHSCTSARNYPSYNSFERRSGVRKSGTLNNIGGIVHGRNGSSSSSSPSSRPSGVQTLSSSHNRAPNGGGSGGGVVGGVVGVGVVGVGVAGGGNTVGVNSHHHNNQNRNNHSIIGNSVAGSGSGSGGDGGVNNTSNKFYRDRNHRSSLERSTSAAIQQYMLTSDDDTSNPERANLITNGSGFGITSSTSGGNLTDIQHQSGGTASCSSSGESANSGSMLVAEHGFVRFRALDDMNNAQGVGIHNASLRTGGRSKEKRFTNNT